METLIEKVATIYRLFLQWCERNPDEGPGGAELILYDTGSGGIIDKEGDWVASWGGPDDGIAQLERRIEQSLPVNASTRGKKISEG